MRKNKILMSLMCASTLATVATPLYVCSCASVTVDTIAITTMPSTEFNLNDKFNYSGIVVTANYSDKTSKEVTSHCTFSQPNMATVGEKEVVVTHVDSGKTATYKINVTDPVTPPEYKITVTFNVNDGSGKTFTQEVKPGKKATKPATPVSTNNFDFVAWYTENGSSGTWDETKRYNFDDVLVQNQQLYARWSSGFNNKSWLDVSNAISVFENIASPTTNDAKTLIESLGVTYESTKLGATVQETLQNHLVGLTGNVVMNEQVHTIRCIDCLHDLLTEQPSGRTDAKAALTFELVTLLSDSKGKYLGSHWSETNNTDYLNSTLRANLNKTGEGTVSWKQIIDPSVSIEQITLPETRSALEMLTESSPNLANAIKSVTKSVATNTQSANAYTLSTYNDKLFALTYTEMAQPENEYALVEGSAYKYWTINEQKETPAEKQNGRKKQDIIKSESMPGTTTGCYPYHLVTPYTKSNGSCYLVNAFANVSTSIAKSMFGTSFAFCI